MIISIMLTSVLKLSQSNLFYSLVNLVFNALLVRGQMLKKILPEFFYYQMTLFNSDKKLLA